MRHMRAPVVAGVAVLAIVGGAVTWLVEPNLIIGLRSGRALAWTLLLVSVCLVVTVEIANATQA